jgi:uncharacterized protein with ATP-grasp and redox domains
MLVINYAVRIQKGKIDYDTLNNLLDDVVSVYLTDNCGITQHDTIMVVNDVKETVRKAAKPRPKAKKAAPKKATRGKSASKKPCKKGRKR